MKSVFSLFGNNKALMAGMVITTTLAPMGAFAQVGSGNIDPGIVQQRFDNKDRAPKAMPDDAVVDQTGKPAADAEVAGPTFVLSDINIIGSTIYTPAELEPIYTKYRGQNVAYNDLRAIAESITALYRQKGYILSRAVLVPQKIENGIVTIQIVEGYVSEIEIQSNTAVRGNPELLKAYAKKVEGVKPLDRATLERYLLLTNDLPGVSARGVLRPASTGEEGAAKLVVVLEQDQFEASVSADNRGSRYLGPYQLSAVAASNSTFRQFDRTTVRGITSGEFEELRFFDVLHEEQIGTEGTKFQGRVAYTETHPGGSLDTFDIDGQSVAVELQLRHPFVRSRTKNMTGRAGFDYRNSDTDVVNINVFDDQVRTAYLGLSGDFVDPAYGVNAVDFEVRRGLDVLGASAGGIDRSRPDADGEFTSLRAEISRVQDLTHGFSIYGSAAGQYAFDPLLASEEFILGGPVYGRAYDAAEITGDHGAAGTVEFRYGQQPGYNLMQSYQLYAFYDIGKVWDKDTPAGLVSHASLASAGGGVRVNVREDLSTGLEVGVPLTRDVAAEGTEGDHPRVFVNVIKRF